LELIFVSEPCLQTNFSENPVEYAAYIIEKYESFIRTVIHSQNTTQIPEEDLFQDFYLALISKPVPENVRDLKGYIYKAIIHHLADSCIRLHNYEKKIKKFRKFYDFKAPQIDPKSALLMKEETDNMFEYIKEVLPGQKYVAIELRYKDGYSLKEIADKMGIKYSSVKKYLSKGIKKVRQCLINT
jgi:RNA polymerase sigma factor (sigma-70 family)